ncbi:MAG: single-stranded DNA-binding protein [Epsilonproteobacteria bacterium]|nr:single-stranded DNA-binding protein [Campylobacterota bacterium]
MASYNRVIMMGNLTRDPEVRQIASGQTVCRLGLASNRQFKNRQTGMMVQEVCFIDVDVWGAQAESCGQYLSKGRPVLVEGRLKLDSWQDNDGNKRNKHSVVADRVTFLSGVQAEDGQEDQSFGGASSADGGQGEFAAESAAPKPVKKAAAKNSTSGEIDLKNEDPFEDDLPF